MRGLAVVSSLLLAHCLYEVPPLADGIDDAAADLETSDATSPCTCVPPIPNGWTLAIFDAGMQPPCPLGWGAPMDWVTNPSAPLSTCTCACGLPTAPPTCDGAATFTVQFGTTNQCSGPMGSVSAATTCTSNATSFPSNQPLTFVKATTNLVPIGGSCAAGTATQMIPPSTFSKGRSCALEGAMIGSCSNGDACVPTGPAPFATCISKNGDNPCPAGFSKKTVVGAGVTDNRACGPNACACAIKGACDPPGLHLYTNGTCTSTGLVANISADGTCYSTSMNISGFTVASSRYNNTFPVNVTCADTSYGPTGALGLASPTTFCCL